MATRPQFVGFGRPAIALRGTGWGSPPEFTPSSIHTAQVVLLNPTDSAWAYRGEVYLDGRIASSGIVEFTIEAGAERPIDFPVVMPEEARSYEAFLDVSVGEELILHYPFEERVTIQAPALPTEQDIIARYPGLLPSQIESAKEQARQRVEELAAMEWVPGMKPPEWGTEAWKEEQYLKALEDILSKMAAAPMAATNVVFKGAVTITSGQPGVPPGDYPIFEVTYRNTKKIGTVALMIVLPELPSSYCPAGWGACFRSFGTAGTYDVPPGTHKHLVVLAVLPAAGLTPGTVKVAAYAWGDGAPLSGMAKDIRISDWHSPNIGTYGPEVIREGIKA